MERLARIQRARIGPVWIAGCVITCGLTVTPASSQDAGQAAAKKVVNRQWLSVATEPDFSPDPKRADAGRFFQFPFDLARQERAAAADVDYSPDGKRLAIAKGWYNASGDVVVWDLEKGQEVFSRWFGLGARSLEFSPDGQSIATAFFDQSARVLSAESGEQLALLPLTGTNGTNSVSFSPDGSTIATGGLHEFVILWDAKTFREKMRFRGHSVRIYCAKFSPDGSMIASVDKEGLGLVWDANTGESISALVGHQGGVELVDFTRDSKHVVTAGWDGHVRFWDPQTGIEDETLRRDLNQLHQGVMALAYSPAEDLIASGGFGKQIEVFDHSTVKAERFAHQQKRQTYGIDFSPDGSEFATANFDGTVKRWDVKTKKLIQTIEHAIDPADDPPAEVTSAAWSRDGKWIASGHSDGTVRIRDPHNGFVARSIAAHQGDVLQIAFHPQGELLVSSGKDGEAHLWNRSTGKEVHALSGHSGPVPAAVFSPDGKTLVTGGADNTVRVWDVTSGDDIAAVLVHQGGVRAIDFSPDGSSLISGDANGKVLRFDTTNWQSKHFVKRPKKLTCVKFSPDGTSVAIGGENGGVVILEPTTGVELSSLDKTFGLSSLAWSPRGKRMIFGNKNGKVIWRDVESGDVLKTFGHHTGPVTSVAYAPSGTGILASGVDKRLLLWRAIPFKQPAAK